MTQITSKSARGEYIPFLVEEHLKNESILKYLIESDGQSNALLDVTVDTSLELKLEVGRMRRRECFCGRACQVSGVAFYI
jgi:hypothetical protein